MPKLYRLRVISDANGLEPDYKEWLCNMIKDGNFSKDHVLQKTKLSSKTLNKWMRGEGLKKRGRQSISSPEIDKLIKETIDSEIVCPRPDDLVDIVTNAINKAAGDGAIMSEVGPSATTLRRIKQRLGIETMTAEIQTKARIKATAEIRNQVSWAAVLKYVVENKKVSNKFCPSRCLYLSL